MSDTFLPINLPSKGQVYDIPAENILVRPYNGEDEMLLSQINPVNLERNFYPVLKRVVQGIDPKMLTLGDRLYLIIWEYINSYSENVTLKGTLCSHCLKKSDVSVDLRKLGVRYLAEDVTFPQEVVLPVSGKAVNLRLFNVGDELAIEKFQESNPDEAYMFRWARTIVSDKDIITLMREMKVWSARDLARLRLFQEDPKHVHGPEITTTFTCSKCGGEDEVVVPFRFEFLYPYGETLRDCFGA